MTAFNRAGTAFGLGMPVGAAIDIARATSDEDGFTRARRNAQAQKANNRPDDGSADDGSVAGQAGEFVYNHGIRQAMGWLGGAATWVDHNVMTPVTDGAEAAYRANYEREISDGRGPVMAAISGLLAVPQGAMGGAASPVLPESVTDDPYFKAERQRSVNGEGNSLGQLSWELFSLGDRGNRMEGDRAVLPLVDDPSRWQDRQDYFDSGAQKYFTGFIDMGTSLALDPTMWVGGAAGLAREGLTKVGAREITQAAAASRVGRGGAKRLEETARKVDDEAFEARTPETTPAGISEGDGLAPKDAPVAVKDDPEQALLDDGIDPTDPRSPALQRMGPADRLKNSVERLTDYAYRRFGENADDGATVAGIAKDPVLGQSPEAGASSELLRYIATTVPDEDVAKNLMDQVQYATMGDRTALSTINEHSKRLALDVERMMRPDDEAAREFIMSSSRLTPEEKLATLNDDDLFKRQADFIREEMEGAISHYSRVESAGTVGQGLDNVGAFNAAADVTSVPLSTGLKRSWRGIGDTRVTKTVQAFKSLPPVHFLSGTQIPETVDLLDNAFPTIGDEYLADSARAFHKTYDTKDAQAVMDGEFRAQLSGARSALDPDLARSERQNVLHRHNRAMEDNLATYWGKKKGTTKAEALAWIRQARKTREGEFNDFMNRARQAVDSDSPLIYRDHDGNVMAASPAVAAQWTKAIMGSQTQQTVALIDWRKMDDMMRKQFRPGLASKDPQQGLWEVADAGLGTINDIWKFGALFRPAYPIRVQMDTQARRLATADVQEMALAATRGIGNGLGRIAKNQRRVPRWATDMYAAKFRAAEELKSLAEDEAWVVGSKGKNAAELASIAQRRAHLESVMDMKPQQFKADMIARGETPDGSLVRMGKTDFKAILGSSMDVRVRDGKFTAPEWDDTYSGGIRDMEENMFGIGRESISGMMSTAHSRAVYRRTKSEYPLVDYGTSVPTRDRWTNAVVEQVNHHVRHDRAMMMMARGVPDEQIAKWMRTSPEGREYFRALNGNKGGEAKWENPMHLITVQRGHYDRLVPSAQAEKTILSREISKEDVAEWWVDDAIRPTIPARVEDALEADKVNAFVDFYQRKRTSYFKWMSVVPEAYMGRHPMYHKMYQQHIKRLTASIGKDRDAITSEQARQLTKRADMLARRDMGRIMFDTSHKSNAAYRMRYLSPFFAAWEDTMRKWATIFAENPAAAPAMYKTFESLRSAGDVYIADDEDGTVRIMPDGTKRKVLEDGSLGEKVGETSNPSEGRLFFQVPGPLGNWMEKEFGHREANFSLGSLNAIFQGEMPFVPGAGPMASIPVNEFVKTGFPIIKADDATFQKLGENGIVKALFLPYGATHEDAKWQMLPSWMESARALVADSTAQSAQTYAMLMQDEVNRQSQEDDHLSPAETMAKVQGQMKAWWGLRLMGSAVVPMSTAPGSELDWYRNEFRSYQRKYGKDAEANFLADYPGYSEVTASLSFNETGIAANADANAEIQPWRKEMAANPTIGWMFAGMANYSGDFNSAAYAAQITSPISGSTSTTFRSKRPKEDALASIQVDKGWKEYGAAQAVIDEELENRGLASVRSKGAEDLLELRNQYIERLSAENESWGIAYDAGSAHGPNPVGDTLRMAYGSLARNPDKVDKREDLSAFREYFMMRKTISDELKARGYDTGFSSETSREENADLLEIWNEGTKRLRDDSIGFANLYSRARLEDDNLNSDPEGNNPDLEVN